MFFNIIRNFILFIGWPVLIAGSIYTFVKGRHVYRLVKGSLIGRIIKVLVYTMLIEMFSIGIVCTVFLFTDAKSVYLVLPIFVANFLIFLWALKVLENADNEAKKFAGQK